MNHHINHRPSTLITTMINRHNVLPMVNDHWIMMVINGWWLSSIILNQSSPSASNHQPFVHSCASLLSLAKGSCSLGPLLRFGEGAWWWCWDVCPWLMATWPIPRCHGWYPMFKRMDDPSVCRRAVVSITPATTVTLEVIMATKLDHPSRQRSNGLLRMVQFTKWNTSSWVVY